MPRYLPQRWFTKPPIGSTVDRSHPMGGQVIGCWLFNENAGTVANDCSGNAQPAVLTPSRASWVSTTRGGAVQTTTSASTEALLIADAPIQRTLTTFLISLRVQAFADSNPTAMLLSRSDLTAPDNNLATFQVFRNSSSALLFYRVGWTSGFTTGTGDISVFDGLYHEVTLAYDGATLTSWVDGVQDVSAAVGHTLNVAANPIHVGWRNSTLNAHANFERLVIYNRPGTLTDATTLYRDPYGMIAPTALRRYWVVSPATDLPRNPIIVNQAVMRAATR